jgi:hypothetical protein
MMSFLLQPVTIIGAATASVVTISRFMAEIEIVRSRPFLAAAIADRASLLRGAMM